MRHSPGLTYIRRRELQRTVPPAGEQSLRKGRLQRFTLKLLYYVPAESTKLQNLYSLYIIYLPVVC